MNENRNETVQITVPKAVAGLFDTAVTLPITFLGFTDNTKALGNKIVDMIANTYNIPEIDYVYMGPIIDNAGKVVDFDMTLYFDTSRTRSQKANISRLGGNGRKGINRMANGGIDGRSLVCNRLRNGGYELSDTFISCLGGVAVLDDDGNIIVNADEDDPRIATVDVDFFKMMAIVLGIPANSIYDFAIISTTPMNNSKDCIDYNLIIGKEIGSGNGVRRSGKSGTNYANRARKKAAANRRRMRG